MDVTLLDNDGRTVRDALEAACASATAVRIAVAFVKGGGLAAAPSLETVAARGGEVQLLAGVDFQLTDLDAVVRFEKPPSAARVYFHPDRAERVVFHPKLYLVDSSDMTTAIVGSSNLTAGGLSHNVEANVLLRGASSEPLFSSIRGFHAKLWDSPFAFPLTERFRQNYARLQDRRRAVELALRAEADFERARRDLRSAIVEAVTSSSSARVRRSWLLITSPANFIRNIEGRIWGDEQKGRIAQVGSGDLISFYITSPVMAIGAMGMVTRDLYEDHSVHWHDGRTYPYRFGFTILLRPQAPVPIRPLIPQLDLFGRRDDPHWGQGLQTSMLRLTPHDSDVLQQALVTASSAGAVA